MGDYLSHMSNPNAAELATRITNLIKDAGQSILSAANETGIPYPTLHRKLTVTPELLNIKELTLLEVFLGLEPFSLFGSKVAA